MSDTRGLFYAEGCAYKKTGIEFQPDRLSDGTLLYEVIRVHGSTCLFLEDHLQRLQDSVALSGIPWDMNGMQIREMLTGLIRLNRFRRGNIKIMLHVVSGREPLLYCYFIPHAYPTREMYRKGVDTVLFRAMRPDPNVKRMYPEIREQVSLFIATARVYEALLVNGDQVTEGSRSNVFFVKHNNLFTPPGDQVLKGITRRKVFDICTKLNIKLFEKPISTNELSNYEAGFLTGTSPKILPIRRIDVHQYKVSNPITNAIARTYDELLAVYIEKNQ